MKIVFMGTPDFAVGSLDILVQNNFDIVGVVTAPDKPAGRGLKLKESAVKQYAVAHHIKVLQPEKLKDPDFLEDLRSLQADLQIVVAFRMLPEVIWDMPPMGTINLHASLLPSYRGAAPINWAIINGETETGVTTFKLRHEIDTGSMLLQKKVAIHPTDTAGDLHDRLMEVGAQTILETVERLQTGSIEPKEQDLAGQYKAAPKIFREHCEVDWNKPTQEVYNLIRGLSPYPAAFTTLYGQQLKLYQVLPEIAEHTNTPGEPISDGKGWLKFATQDGYIQVLDLQLEGKKRMSTEAFLKGYRF